MQTQFELSRDGAALQHDALTVPPSKSMAHRGPRPQQDAPPIGNGILTGQLVGFHDEVVPLVDFPANSTGGYLAARTVIPLSVGALGSDVLLAFEQGNTQMPIILGRIHRPHTASSQPPVHVLLDGTSLTLSAEKEIVLRCGKASITLTHAGKVLIRGEYVLSASKGVNRVRGGSVHIN